MALELGRQQLSKADLEAIIMRMTGEALTGLPASCSMQLPVLIPRSAHTIQKQEGLAWQGCLGSAYQYY